MKKLLLPLAGASALLISGHAQAAVEICDTPNCAPAQDNVLFDKADSLLTITGSVNDAVVVFTSPFGELLTAPANGQTRLTAADGVLNGVTLALQSGAAFASANFNVNALERSELGASLIDISYMLTNGVTGSQQFNIDNGENKFGIFGAPDGEGFLSITINANPQGTGYLDLRQVKLGGLTPVSPVPEPATWAMMILGLGFIGAALRRRQKTAVRFAF